MSPESVRERYAQICAEVGARVTVVAATKYVSLDEMAVLLAAGVEVVGENRAQDLERKHARFGDAFRWHFIGHLQSNKAKIVNRICELVHSLDSESTARRLTTPALALLHAGRVGLLAGIAGVGVGALGGRVAAIVGPGIGPCCYEVGDDIRDAYRRRYGAAVTRGRNLDLWSVAERELRAAGAVAVERTDLCTACNPREFFSHRRDGAVTGRQGVIGYVA